MRYSESSIEARLCQYDINSKNVIIIKMRQNAARANTPNSLLLNGRSKEFGVALFSVQAFDTDGDDASGGTLGSADLSDTTAACCGGAEAALLSGSACVGL